MFFDAMSLILLISSSTFLCFLSFKSPMLMTISISLAPSINACSVSFSLTDVLLYPLGKPITVQIFKSLELLLAKRTKDGGIHMLATLYSIPSCISFNISFSVLFGFKRV